MLTDYFPAGIQQEYRNAEVNGRLFKWLPKQIDAVGISAQVLDCRSVQLKNIGKGRQGSLRHAVVTIQENRVLPVEKDLCGGPGESMLDEETQ